MIITHTKIALIIGSMFISIGAFMTTYLDGHNSSEKASAVPITVPAKPKTLVSIKCRELDVYYKDIDVDKVTIDYNSGGDRYSFPVMNSEGGTDIVMVPTSRCVKIIYIKPK